MRLFSVSAVLAMLLAAACGGGGGGGTTDSATTPDASVADETPPDAGEETADEFAHEPGPADAPPEAAPPSEQCLALKEGKNTKFVANGVERELLLNLPPDVETKGPWPVVFMWHGFVGDYDMTADFAAVFASFVDDAAFPFILVTPRGQSVFPNWDVLEVFAGEPNDDIALFDDLLACLDARFGVDPDRVFTSGFSAGGIMSDLIGVLRGDVIASVLTWSGGYLGNPANDTGFNVTWPKDPPGNGYPQTVIAGGANDQYMGMVHFDQFAGNDVPYLNRSGHDVIRCNHGGQHTIPFGFQGRQALEFFRAHPRGTTASPWVTAGLPADYPKYCEFKGKE